MLPASVMKTTVNPYSEWIHDHPAHLLPDPSPALLEEKRAEGPVGSGRVIVELGSGAGNFLLHMGLLHPADHFIGFELRYKRLVKAARKLEQEGVRNVWLLREEAERFGGYFAPGSVDRVYFNFPDPWPKPSQWKKRLFNPGLLSCLAETLKEGGQVCLKTDHSGYFLHVLALLWNRRPWRIAHFSNDFHRYGPPGPNLRSEFEQLFAAKGKPIFFVSAEKRAAG